MRASVWNTAALHFFVALYFCGCARSPKPQTDQLPVAVPSQYSSLLPSTTSEPILWLNDFGAPELQAIVDEVLANNYDLDAAAARLEAAIATQRTVLAGRFPSVNGTFSGSRQKNNFQNLAGSIGTRIFNNYNLNYRVAWELDLWAKIKNRTQASIADVEAEEANLRGARLSLAAAALRSWFDLVATESQVQLADQTVSVFEQNLAVVEASFERGLPDRALDVRLTRANVENARSTQAARRRQRDATMRALESLLGRYPDASVAVSTKLPQLRETIPPGLPSDLLHRRPDLLIAERRLAAAAERVKVARKDLLPTISLSSGAGTSSGDLKGVLDPDRLIWNLAGNVAQPIFNGGRLIAGIKGAKANRNQALATYAQTALNAFQEVETLLAGELFLRDELDATRRAAKESVAAEELAWQQYQRGLVDIITVLESQRRAFTAQSSVITAINAQLRNRINLYLALGGNFDTASQTIETASE